MAALEEKTLNAACKGYGIPLQDIPKPYMQRGLECQTMALINGVNSIQRKYIEGKDISGFSSRLRDKAEHDGHSSLNMIWVEKYMPYEGIPLIGRDSPLNPIALAKSLFSENTFLVISDEAAFHATTLIPLADATREYFTARISSLGGRIMPMKLHEYFNMILSVKIFEDNYRIYSVAPLNDKCIQIR